MRESKDEILIGELVRAMARLGCPAIRFNADAGAQFVQFKPRNDEILHSITVLLDRKTGDSALVSALVGNKAVLTITAETKNYLADPDDLIHMYRTDLANIFKMPMLGDVRLNHQLNSVLATKKLLIEIDDYILKGEESAQRLVRDIQSIVGELRAKLQPYKKK